MLLFSSAYNEYTVISKEYTGPLDFDITGVSILIGNGVTSIILPLVVIDDNIPEFGEVFILRLIRVELLDPSL